MCHWFGGMSCQVKIGRPESWADNNTCLAVANTPELVMKKPVWRSRAREWWMFWRNGGLIRHDSSGADDIPLTDRLFKKVNQRGRRREETGGVASG